MTSANCKPVIPRGLFDARWAIINPSYTLSIFTHITGFKTFKLKFTSALLKHYKLSLSDDFIQKFRVLFTKFHFSEICHCYVANFFQFL